MKQLRYRLAAVTAALLVSASAMAATGPWQARVRATYLSMADQSDAFSALGINFGKDAVSVNSKFIPEFDFSYSFTQNWVAELVLTIPQTQEVKLAGVGKLGTFKHLPPVLAMQYHFAPGTSVNPYIGAGLNYTLIYGRDLKVATVPLTLDNNSIGLAVQAGADIDIGNGMYVNLDIKKVGLRSDVYVATNGARLTTAKLDPWLFSVGLGWKF